MISRFARNRRRDSARSKPNQRATSTSDYAHRRRWPDFATSGSRSRPSTTADVANDGEDTSPERERRDAAPSLGTQPENTGRERPPKRPFRGRHRFSSRKSDCRARAIDVYHDARRAGLRRVAVVPASPPLVNGCCDRLRSLDIAGAGFDPIESRPQPEPRFMPAQKTVRKPQLATVFASERVCVG